MWLSFKKTIFNATIFKGEQSTCLCWCQGFHNTAGFSWLNDTRKELGFTEFWMVPFWITASWVILWKNLCCLFAKKLALLSLQRVFCSPTVWFTASVVVILCLAHLKLSFPQRELTKHRNLVTCSQYCAEGSDVISQLISSSSASMSEKTLVPPFISRKPTFPVCVCTVLLKNFHCHENNPSWHRKQRTHPGEISGYNMPLLIHVWSLVKSVAQKIWG